MKTLLGLVLGILIGGMIAMALFSMFEGKPNTTLKTAAQTPPPPVIATTTPTPEPQRFYWDANLYTPYSNEYMAPCSIFHDIKYQQDYLVCPGAGITPLLKTGEPWRSNTAP